MGFHQQKAYQIKPRIGSNSGVVFEGAVINLTITPSSEFPNSLLRNSPSCSRPYAANADKSRHEVVFDQICSVFLGLPSRRRFFSVALTQDQAL